MSKKCSVPACENKAVSRTWCITHYSRWRLHGDVQADIPVRAIGQQATCCDAKHYANGLCANHYMQQWARDNPERMQLREVRHSAVKVGLDPAEVVAHFMEHPGICDICGRKAADVSGGEGRRRGRLSIDHDHRTRTFRGLLCNPCNQAIGFMDDDPSRLEAAARYLRHRP